MSLTDMQRWRMRSLIPQFPMRQGPDDGAPMQSPIGQAPMLPNPTQNPTPPAHSLGDSNINQQPQFPRNPTQTGQGGAPFNQNAFYVQEPIPGMSRMDAPELNKTPHQRGYLDWLQGNEEPLRKDYQMGKVGKILSGVAGFVEGANRGPARAFEVTKGLLEHPYATAAEEYKTKGARLKELATTEKGMLESERDWATTHTGTGLQRWELIQQDVLRQSQVKLNQAEAANLENMIYNRGLTLQRNDRDGQLYVVDQMNKTTTPLGQFYETVKEQEARTGREFAANENLSQRNRVALEGVQAGHRMDELFQMGMNAEALERTRKELEAEFPGATQDNAAFTGAYQEVLATNPLMKDELFVTDAEGNMSLKPNYNKDVYNMFLSAIEDTRRKKLGQPTSYQSGVPNVPVAGSGGAGPNVFSPEQAATRIAAMKWLKDHGNLPQSEANIQKAMEAIRQEMQKQQGTTPQVTVPQGGPQSFLGPNFGQLNPQFQEEMSRVTNPVAQNFVNPLVGAYQDLRNTVRPMIQDTVRGFQGAPAPTPSSRFPSQTGPNQAWTVDRYGRRVPVNR